MSKNKLPPEPRFKPIEIGSDKAVSESIQKLLSKEDPEVYMNANLTHRERLSDNLMRNIGQNFQLDFLLDYVKGDCILSTAENSKRSEQIVTVVKQPDIHMEGGGSILGNFRDKIFH